MPKIKLERPLSVPAVPARASASSIMHAIQAGSDGWEEFALYLDFGALGLPDVGYIAVPVTISDIKEALEPRHQIAFVLKARRSPEAFPVLIGAIGIDATGPSLSEIWLGGDYEVPMHALGGLINQTLARGAAEKTLNNMLNELADAIEAHVQQRERAHARYRLVFNTGA